MPAPDHFIIVSDDFTKSYDDWQKAGFTVVPKPIVEDDPLDHMWVTLPDGTFIELIKFKKTGTGLSWEGKGNGWIDYCLYVDNAAEYQKYLENNGLPYHGPYGDANAPAIQIYPKTEAAAPHLLPFVIQWNDRSKHVPMDAAATTHGNEAKGFKDIQVVAKDVPKATEAYKKLLGAEPTEAHGASARFASGPGTITITDAWGAPLKAQLLTKGEGIYKLLVTTSRADLVGTTVTLDGADVEFVAA
ncbi:hypothetical protein DFJ74DRAFT_701593 [Hyaloraphidium curvatum]|nr:hypothetical protein DFJ74DRAFT_701593 [Hyaloraphidium curvatum]